MSAQIDDEDRVKTNDSTATVFIDRKNNQRENERVEEKEFLLNRLQKKYGGYYRLSSQYGPCHRVSLSTTTGPDIDHRKYQAVDPKVSKVPKALLIIISFSFPFSFGVGGGNKTKIDCLYDLTILVYRLVVMILPTYRPAHVDENINDTGYPWWMPMRPTRYKQLNHDRRWLALLLPSFFPT